MSETIENFVGLKHYFDKEYSTQIRMEKEWLEDAGFKCSFTKVKIVNGARIYTWKYAKTPELFEALANFYRLKDEYDAQKKQGVTEFEGACSALKKYDKAFNEAYQKKQKKDDAT